MPRNPKNPYFSHGFLRVFYGFLRVFYGLGKHDVFPKHDVFEFHYGFSTGYDGFSTGSLGFLHLVLYFSQKIRTSSMLHCEKTIHGSLVFTGSFAGQLRCGSKIELETID